MASNYDGNKGVNGNGLLYFIGKVKTWIDTYFLKKNLGSSKASKVVVTDSSGNVDVSTITSTELGYLSGVTSAIQTQIGNKANQTDLTDLGNSFGTFSTTTVPNTYQQKIKVGTADSGAVTTISAGSNTSITISGTTATIASTTPVMTDSVRGGAKVFSNTAQPVAANDVSTIAGRTYGVQKNSSEQLVVNVPWTDTRYTLPMADESTLGGIKVFDPFYTDKGLLCLNYDSSLYVNDLGNLAVTQATGTQGGKVYLFGADNQVTSSTLANEGTASYALLTEKFNAKAPLASPALTGTPTAPTAATSTNTTQIATTAFVHAAIENADIGGKTYQGNIDAENSATGKRALKDIKTFKQGQYFTVSSAFTFADGSWALGIGDMLFVKENYTWASGNVDGSKFAAVQGNNDYLTNKELDAIFTEVFGSAA